MENFNVITKKFYLSSVDIIKKGYKYCKMLQFEKI